MIDEKAILDIVNSIEIASLLKKTKNESYEAGFSLMFKHPVLLFRNGRVDFHKNKIHLSIKSSDNLSSKCNEYKNQLISVNHYSGYKYYIANIECNYEDHNLEAIKELINIFAY